MVTKGKVGVGWLDGRRKFVDKVPVAAGAEVSVELLATAPFDLGPLMVRNWSSAEASIATILGIECFAIAAGETDSDVARTPPLSEPEVVSHWSRDRRHPRTGTEGTRQSPAFRITHRTAHAHVERQAVDADPSQGPALAGRLCLRYPTSQTLSVC